MSHCKYSFIPIRLQVTLVTILVATLIIGYVQPNCNVLFSLGSTECFRQYIRTPTLNLLCLSTYTAKILFTELFDEPNHLSPFLLF